MRTNSCQCVDDVNAVLNRFAVGEFQILCPKIYETYDQGPWTVDPSFESDRLCIGRLLFFRYQRSVTPGAMLDGLSASTRLSFVGSLPHETHSW